VWPKVARARTETQARQRSGIPECCSAAAVFEHGAGDGNRTRTVSLGRVLIPPCFRVLQRYWRPQLASGDPCRPGRVARVWPGSLGSRAAETYARRPELFVWERRRARRPHARSDATEPATADAWPRIAATRRGFLCAKDVKDTVCPWP
jgi:hypothetical protein